MKKIPVKQTLWMLLSIAVMAFGIALFKVANYGNDPFTGMCFGVVEKYGFTLGATECVVNLFLFVLQLIFLRERIGLGTVVNAFGLGYAVDFWLAAQRSVLGAEPATAVRILCCLVALIITSFACSLYFTVNMGVSPYDSAGFILDKLTPLPFGVCREMTDLLCVIICFALGGVIGMGTLISALGMGPIISWFNRHVSQKLLAEFAAK